MEISSALFDKFLPDSSVTVDVMSFGPQLSDVYNSQEIDSIKDGQCKIPVTKTWLSGFLYMLFATPTCQEKQLLFGEIFYESERLIFTTLGKEPTQIEHWVYDAPKMYIFAFSLAENTKPYPSIDKRLFERMKSHVEMRNREHLIQDALSRVRFVTFKSHPSGRRIFHTSEMSSTVDEQFRTVDIRTCRIEPLDKKGELKLYF